jgi:endonuclease/exonuclease/phosphatase family metal-dependent hydrolase
MERELLRPGVPRPADLHRAALIAQGRLAPDAPMPVATDLAVPSGDEPVITPVVVPSLSPLFTSAPVEKQFRVMTYNVHSCIGMDQRHDPQRIARVIAHYLPDVVALQELETNLPRSVGMNQAHRIAELLQLEYRFHAVREKDDGAFGNAILTRHPLRLLRSGGLPCLTGRRGCETRGALWVEIEIEGMRLQVLNTHLGLWPRERLMQVKALFGPRWLGGRDKSVPLVLCGDLNCGPRSPTYRELSRHLHDSQLQLHKHRPRNTWFTGFPVARIDHVFVSDSLRTRRIHVPSFHLSRMASDHLPLVADIMFEPVPTGAEARFTPEPSHALTGEELTHPMKAERA